MVTRPSFKVACAKFVNRYTAEHVPAWASKPCEGNGLYYAPQFASDKEWFDNTKFYGEVGHVGNKSDCYTSGQTWPFGNWLSAPYVIGVEPAKVGNLDASYGVTLAHMLDEDGVTLAHMLDEDDVTLAHMLDEDDGAFIAAAANLYANDECEFDDGAKVSRGEGGAFVQAWLWVSDDQAGIESKYTAVEVDGESYEYNEDSVCFKREDGDFEFWFYHRQAEPTVEVITTLIRAANAGEKV